MKKRIDRLLVEKGMADSREKAQALIMAGSVLVDNVAVTKAGAAVEESLPIRLKNAPHPFVGRGGLKLEGALQAFGIAVEGKVCLDIGASTGGFTHCLLLRGAARVFALDVDVRQLDWKIQTDPRVQPVELNARFLEPGHLDQSVDIVTVDASFISLTMLLPVIPPVLKAGGYCVALVKPQFEVGKGQVGKKGIVRDEELQQQAVGRIIEAGKASGLCFRARQESPITGREGNREFFLLFQRP